MGEEGKDMSEENKIMTATEVLDRQNKWLEEIRKKLTSENEGVLLELIKDMVAYGTCRSYVSEKGKIVRIPPEEWEKEQLT